MTDAASFVIAEAGISPMAYRELAGTVARRDHAAEEPLQP